MSAGFRSNSTQSFNNTTSVKVTKNTTAVAGDIVFLYVYYAGNAGWNATCSGFTAVNDSQGNATLLYRTLDGSEGSKFTVTISNTASGCLIYDHLRGFTLDVVGTANGVTGSSVSVTANSITIGHAGTWTFLYGGFHRTPSNKITAFTPAGFSGIPYESRNDAYHAVRAYSAIQPTGATGSKSFSLSSSSFFRTAVMASVYPTSGGTVLLSGVPAVTSAAAIPGDAIVPTTGTEWTVSDNALMSIDRYEGFSGATIPGQKQALKISCVSGDSLYSESFESGNGGWTADAGYTVAQSSAWSKDGSNSATVSGSGSTPLSVYSPAINVQAGDDHTASAWVGASSGGAPAFVQKVCSGPTPLSGNVFTFTVDSGVTTTAGNAVILSVRLFGGSKIASITDSRGNTWQLDNNSPVPDSGSNALVASAVMGSSTFLRAGDTISVTGTGGGNNGVPNPQGGAVEFSGLDTTGGALTVQALVNTHVSASPAAATTSVGSTLPNDLAVSAGAGGAAANSLTLTAADVSSGGTWTDIHCPVPGSGIGTGVDMAYQVATSSTAFSVSWSFGSGNGGAAITVYKAASHPAGATATIGINWYSDSAATTLLSSSSGSSVSVSTLASQLKARATAPDTAVAAKITITYSSAGTGNFDLAKLVDMMATTPVVVNYTPHIPVTPPKGLTWGMWVKPNDPDTIDALATVNAYDASNVQTNTSTDETYALPADWSPLSGTADTTSELGGDTTEYATLSVTFQMTRGQVVWVDCVDAIASNYAVLIDWLNPVFSTQSNAGDAFADMTGRVRHDQAITISRGRQDAMSEVQSGQASFMLQNDDGWFTPKRSTSPFYPNITLGKRVQILATDETGLWYTRFDGSLTQLDYTIDTTGNTNTCQVSASDVMALLNRQPELYCWTKQTVLNDGAWLHWTLDDAQSPCVETSGNGGPVMRETPANKTPADASQGIISFGQSTGGVESLADAVGAGNPDGSQYWPVGTVIPNQLNRGLAPKVLGPYQSPLQSVYFTPVLTAQTDQNLFLGNKGYGLTAQLPPDKMLAMDDSSNNYTLECWFTMDPAIKAGSDVANSALSSSPEYGPYVIVSLGSTRRARPVGQGLPCFVAGIFYVGNQLNLVLNTYNMPPAFTAYSGSTPQALQSVSTAIEADDVQLPHHLVIEFEGDDGGAIVSAWLDGEQFSFGDMTMHRHQAYDALTVGAAYGGYGVHSGGVQLVSVYQSLLDESTIINHTAVGQYGAWESTTDDAIAVLDDFANIPSFWDGVTGQHNGLSFTDYQDITGSNALTNMQYYEWVESGLLFVDATGVLQFHTRDWRMGYGAPDLQIPPDTYTADLGYQLTDQFLVNKSAVSTQIFTSSTIASDQTSLDLYGPYTDGTIISPNQYPLFAFNRAFAALGLNSYTYWTEPYMVDVMNWEVQTRSDPDLLAGQLTIDLLTLNPNSGLGISDFYTIDIDNMVELVGELPRSLPDIDTPHDLFIEGVTETISNQQRQVQFFTSPGAKHRAWQAGDPDYGVLGKTTRIGISGPDLNTPPALGKSVSHDAGPPYWPPQFTSVQTMVYTEDFELGTGSFTVDPGSALRSTHYFHSGTHSLGFTVTGPFTATSPDIAVTSLASGTPITAGGWIWRSGKGASVSISLSWYDSSNTLLQQTNGQTKQLTSNQKHLTVSDTVPSGADHVSIVFAYDSRLCGELDMVQLWVNNPAATITSMNNPADDGHSFVGANDIRGLTDSLQTAIYPPMLVVGQLSTQQTIGSGSSSDPRIAFDEIYVDTWGGFGAIPNWQNWYVCLREGFYEIDMSGVWVQSSGSNSKTRLGYMVVARQAAQAVAAGTGTPLTVNQYVCPVGEQQRFNNVSLNPVNSASTRVYLGLGDMVTSAMLQNQGSNDTTGTALGGSILSLRWVGYGTTHDQVRVLTSIGGGGSTTPEPVQPTTFAHVYTGVHTYSYTGDGHKFNTDGWCYQAAPGHFSFVLWPYATIASDLSGATISKVELTTTNRKTTRPDGALLHLGWSSRTSFPNSGVKHTNKDNPGTISDQFFNRYQQRTMVLPNYYATRFVDSSMTSTLIGNFSEHDQGRYDGAWGSGPDDWQLKITYTK